MPNPVSWEEEPQVIAHTQYQLARKQLWREEPWGTGRQTADGNTLLKSSYYNY